MIRGDAVLASVADTRRHQRRHLTATYMLLMAVAVLTVGIMLLFGQHMSPIALAMMLLGSLVILAHPASGVHLIVIFTLLSDINTTPWYPFAKNFSSRESVLFVDDRLSINPLEVFLMLTVASWLARGIGHGALNFRRGVLLNPVLVFAGFVFLGFAYGIARGGDTTVAVWEARPLFYLPIFYVLVTNLFTTVRQYQVLFWAAMIAVTVQSVLAIDWYRDLPAGVRANLESLTEHSGAVHMNALFVFVLAALLIRGFPARGRLILPIMAIPVVWAYFLSERRAAFIGFALGMLLFSMLLYRLERRVFWWFVPIVGILSLGYLGAFWNSESAAGFPAQAIKTVIAPGSVGAANKSSDDYRVIEGIDIWFTIRTDPLRGIGFGHAFYQIYQLPDISFFIFWRYMPHHSFLWIWLKTGIGGFVSMLYLMIRTIQHGVRSTLQFPPGTTRAMCIASTLYVAMYLVYSYVDIAWDIRSMIFMAVVMAVCADLIGLYKRTVVMYVSDDTEEETMQSVTI